MPTVRSMHSYGMFVSLSLCFYLESANTIRNAVRAKVNVTLDTTLDSLCTPAEVRYGVGINSPICGAAQTDMTSQYRESYSLFESLAVL